jgi:hypothetical protein
MTDIAPIRHPGRHAALSQRSGAVFGLAFPWMASQPTYTDLPPYWSPAPRLGAENTPKKEDMWAAAVAIAATKLCGARLHHQGQPGQLAQGQRQPAAAQARERRRGLGAVRAQGDARFADDCDNGVFIRIRRAGTR